jgi:hypothetical protein
LRADTAARCADLAAVTDGFAARVADLSRAADRSRSADFFVGAARLGLAAAGRVALRFAGAPFFFFIT